MVKISGFHAHVYYDETTYAQAVKLCDEAGEKFTLSVGEKHRKPIGPHLQWNCLLTFKPEIFGELVPWLALHRNGLTLLIHTETGDLLKDHTEYTIWMGEPLALDLKMFQ